MRLVDANIFLRYLTRDDEGKAEGCRRLFLRLASGEEAALTTELIVHEALYVLTSRAHYGLNHAEAAARMRPLLSVRRLRLDNKRRCLRALDIYAAHANLDFPDAVNVALMEELGISEIYSYDTDFDQIQGVSRIEP
jgi:predicted nucleic acid-binding protein